MGLLYSFFKYSGRIALPIYFGRLEINGKENVPKDQPYIIASNHQSAFLDAVLLGSFAHKPVHFLTRSDVFVKPFIGALKALNMMPVYRIRDGYEKLSKNEEVFAKCNHLLSQGLPVLIFPEGNMGEGHYLRPLTKGTARMAFQAQEVIGKDVMILPIGINYFHHYRPRYKCIINYGTPIQVKDYVSHYEENKAKGLIKLRDDLSDSIKELLVIPEKDGFAEKVKALHRNNEHLNFQSLKNTIEEKSANQPNYTTSLQWLPSLLSIFNPLTIGAVTYVLRNVVKEKQFTSSLKYTLGLVLSMIWWFLLFIITTMIWSWEIGVAATLVSIAMLLWRSDLKKRFVPIHSA